MIVLLNSSVHVNSFNSKASGSGVILSGNLGNILTLTPPAGQRVRITHLSIKVGDAPANLNNVKISFGGTDVAGVGFISGEFPSGTSPSGMIFSIGSYFSYAAGNPPFNNHEYFTGGTDEVFILSMPPALTNLVNFYYSYQFGE